MFEANRLEIKKPRMFSPCSLPSSPALGCPCLLNGCHLLLQLRKFRSQDSNLGPAGFPELVQIFFCACEPQQRSPTFAVQRAVRETGGT